MQDEHQTNGDTGTDITAEAAAEPKNTGKQPPRKRAARRRAASRPAGPPQESGGGESAVTAESPTQQESEPTSGKASSLEPPEQPPASGEAETAPAAAGGSALRGTAAGTVLFQAPEFISPEPEPVDQVAEPERDEASEQPEDDDSESSAPRRRRRRGGRGRRRKSEDGSDEPTGQAEDETPVVDDVGADDGRKQPAAATDDDQDQSDDADSEADSGDGQASAGSRRRRRRKRKGDGDGEDVRSDDPPNTVVKVREPREVEDEVTKVTGSTRLEAKKQRRREGREAGRRRAPVISESEFLARRESVERVMTVRQSGERTQIAVIEDGVLVEHYVGRASEQPLIGNVYLGRVQNVLPAMEAAFVDIGRGRNAVLYAGEVDWAGLGHTDGQKRIEEVLKSGQSVLVQVTKEPSGHKGARLTSQISLPGRYVVYVPGGSMSGISRKLPEKERNRLKKILKQVVPDDAGVIVRTAAEGASEEELTHDVSRLRAQWEEIQKKASGSAPQLLYGEPDLAIKVVRDLFNEDFTKLVVSGNDAWNTIEPYVSYVATSLRDRLEKWSGDGDIFSAYRVDEQIAKALERKVWLPSGGSLVIDRTEAMTVIDVNTGKFTGSGGNLEETVTKNNLEAAEEIVRQLRLRDIGGIIVIDFIDMVLEANRDLVLRRLVECLGRDRTKHQVAEVTSLGLVQMTRKRIGSGLLESFSEPCEHCNGRGLHIHDEPVDDKGVPVGDGRASRAGRRDRRRRSDKASPEAASVPASSKLEATAHPGKASPADLMPVDAAGRGADSGSTGPAVEAANVTAAAEGFSAPAEEASLETAPEPTADTAPAPTADTAARTSAETPTETASEAGGTTAEAPAGLAAEASAETATEVPAETAGEAPADTGAEAPAETARAGRRGRRRVQRPAGSPDQGAAGSSAAADDADTVVSPV